MIHDKKLHMKIRNRQIGPGGWNCPCCAPAPGKPRKVYAKLSKKRERLFVERLVKDEE